MGCYIFIEKARITWRRGFILRHKITFSKVFFKTMTILFFIYFLSYQSNNTVIQKVKNVNPVSGSTMIRTHDLLDMILFP